MKINKKNSKILMLVGTMIMSSSLFAASSASGKVDGYNAYGNVSMGSSMASAQTRCDVDAACIAEITYTYQFGPDVFEETNSTSNLKSTSAVVYAEYKPAHNVRAAGAHEVYRNNDYWRGYTSV